VADVDDYLKALDHPKKAEIEALRAIILATDAGITESVKWNAPNFATTDDFATMNLRPNAVRVILHTGAKPKPEHPEIVVDDPDALLARLGTNRVMATFSDAADIEAKRDAFTTIVRQWVAQLNG
jgi:hypothetical protein